LNQYDIQILDIGAHGGELAQFRNLASVITYIACESDEQEANRLRKTVNQDSGWKNINVISDALAQKKGEADLYLTKQPGLSSLLKPDEKVFQQFYEIDYYRILSKTKVQCIPLDEAVSKYSMENVCFLKVDTQGTELDILQSGKKIIGKCSRNSC